MRRGRLGLCAFTLRSGISIPTRLACSGFRRAGIWSQRSARISRSVLYPAVDAADKESCRPDFAVPIYPGHLSLSRGGMGCQPGRQRSTCSVIRPMPIESLPRIPIFPSPAQTPPTFLLQAEDDHVDDGLTRLARVLHCAEAGWDPCRDAFVSAGGMRSGCGAPKLPITGWPQLVETWLGTIGMISGVGDLGSHTTNGTCRSRSSCSSQNWTLLALCFVVPATGRTEEVWSLPPRHESNAR